MAKSKINYKCSKCGYVSTLLIYRCPQCSEFNTFDIDIERRPTKPLRARKYETDANGQKVLKMPSRASINSTGQNFREYPSQIIMFDSLWMKELRRNKKVVSALSGRDITHFKEGDLWISSMAHILPKGEYPLFKLYSGNIMIIHFYEHDLIDLGTKKERKEYESKYNCSFEPFYEKRKELLELYNQIK